MPRNQNHRQSSFTDKASKPFVAEEDQLPTAGKAVADTSPSMEHVGSPNESISSSEISLLCTPERNELSVNAVKNFFININLKATGTTAEVASTRVPMDIVCVLDTSGSMQGGKIESLKVAMEFVRSQLTGEDRLSVVEFNSYANLTHGLLRMDDVKKMRSEQLTNGLRANGGTNIYSGMRGAMDILTARVTHNALSCVFLLTDGQDGSNANEKKVLGQQMKAAGHSLFVFGFGADHDAAQLQSIANAAEGSFSYVEADSMVIDAFGGAIGGQQGTIATNVSVVLQVPAEAVGVELVRASAGRYSCSRQTNGTYLISYANLYDGEQRDILAVVSVPASEAAAAYSLLSASASYTDIHGEPLRAVARESSVSSAASAGSGLGFVSTCTVLRSPTPSSEANSSVEVQVTRAKGIAALEQAMQSADAGKYSAGTTLLEACIREIEATATVHDPVVKSTLEDLQEGIVKTKNSAEYNSRGGRSAMCENHSKQSAQRSCYTNASKHYSPYQTVQSEIQQGSARAYKNSKGYF